MGFGHAHFEKSPLGCAYGYGRYPTGRWVIGLSDWRVNLCLFHNSNLGTFGYQPHNHISHMGDIVNGADLLKAVIR